MNTAAKHNNLARYGKTQVNLVLKDPDFIALQEIMDARDITHKAEMLRLLIREEKLRLHKINGLADAASQG